ncbi:MAG TPA: glycoside hydrolase family 97 protein [Candidatus Aquilonibacter sp.]|nr:glycoside hydrolase family 97 protein [Candidatus Aquilonibacter sp.]
MRYSILPFLFAATVVFSQTNQTSVTSPDGRLTITFQTATNTTSGDAARRTLSPQYQAAPGGGQLVYTVSFQGKTVFEPSALALDLQGQKPELGQNVKLVNASASQGDDDYTLFHGKTSHVNDHYNALQLEFSETAVPGRKLIIEARAYNDAVAFRYLVPAQTGLHDFRLVKEDTEFRPVKDAMSYSLELPNFRSMYESEFIQLPLSAFSNQGGVGSEILIGCPMLLHLPGVAWVAITDADLRDYSSMYLVNSSRSWLGHWLVSRLAPQVENTNLCVTGTLPHHSSWRVLMVADDPGRFIESTVITDLNPPCAITNTSWIEPGKSAWDWWGGSRGPDGKSAHTTATEEYYVDFAAKSSFKYMLVDGGWSAPGDITKMNGSVDVPAVVRYAAAKGVKVWVWAGYADLSRQMDEAFPLYEKWGIAGVKTDFIERDDQKGMDFYYETAEKAAKYHLMMDYHGATKPSGIERTWPNIMGYEAVAGMEQNKAGARDNPRHHVMLPFTRMLAGPMDYTPGGFDNVTEDEFEPRMNQPMVMGTRAQQLAMYVVYDAPFQMVSDWPGNYEGQPAFQFIEDVPTTWDETKELNGVPGEYITMARRNGNDWYLGSMTDWTPRTLEVPLNFLGSGKFTAEIYADAKDAGQFPKHASIEKQTVQATGKLELQLAPGGGCAVRFVLEQ